MSRKNQISDPNRVKKVDQAVLQNAVNSDIKRDDTASHGSAEQKSVEKLKDLKPQKIIEGRRMSQVNAPLIKVHQQPILQIKIEPFSNLVIKSLNLEYKNIYLGKKTSSGEFKRFYGDHIKENTEIFLKIDELANFVPLDSRYHPVVDLKITDLETKEVKQMRKNIIDKSLDDAELAGFLVPITKISIKTYEKFYCLNIVVEDDKNNVKSFLDIDFRFHVVNPLASEMDIWDSISHEVTFSDIIPKVNIYQQGLTFELLDFFEGSRNLDIPLELPVGSNIVMKVSDLKGLNYNHAKAYVGLAALILRDDGEEILREVDFYHDKRDGIKETEPNAEFEVKFYKFSDGISQKTLKKH